MVGFIKKALFWFSVSSVSCATAQNITTFAGGGTSGLGDGGLAIAAQVTNPSGGGFDSTGNYYFLQSFGSPRIRKVTPFGIIQTVAGNGTTGFSGDGGIATSAQMHPQGFTVDARGNVYIADFYNYRVRKVDAATGIISTIAGNGIAAFTGDGGPAILASLSPVNLCIDTLGNIYFIDGNANRVRKVSVTGIVTTIAGNGLVGSSGDGGLATAAELALEPGICIDLHGNLFIACVGKVRKVDLATGIISTYAGNGSTTYIGDGMSATSAQFQAYEIGINQLTDDLYIADFSNDRVYRVDPSGLFHLIAGDGTTGFSGDGGPANLAKLHNPEGVVTDVCGNLYIADDANNRIRKVTFNPPTAATVAITGITAAALGATVTVSAAVSGAGTSYSIKWFNKGVQFATTATPVVTFTKVHNIDSITARIVPAITYCYDSAMSNLHIVTKSSVGIEPLQEASSVSVYPNPAHSHITVTGSNITAITISNPLGQALITTTQTGVDISALPAGIYSIKVMQAGGYQTGQKFIKQ
ncbi:MAG: T9SS type A sorting domain-containing protein [Bacteroidota bacterium]